MSDLWLYNPDYCEGHPCPGDCDNCSWPEVYLEDEEHNAPDLCTDNRFEIIKKYRQRIIEATNIETSPDEMKVLESILFRFWQLGWLDKLEVDE